MADSVNKAVHESKKFDWQSIQEHCQRKQGEVTNSETNQQNYLILVILQWLPQPCNTIHE